MRLCATKIRWSETDAVGRIVGGCTSQTHETGCNHHCVNLVPKLTGTVHFGGVTIRQFFLYAYEFRLALLYSLCNDNLNKYFITRRLLKRYSFPFAMKVNHLYSSRHNYSDLVFLHICVRILHCVIGSIIRLLYKSRIIHALIFRKLKKTVLYLIYDVNCIQRNAFVLHKQRWPIIFNAVHSFIGNTCSVVRRVLLRRFKT